MSVALADITGKPRVIDGDTIEIAGDTPCGGIGRHAGFKIPFSQGSGSSILPGGTIFRLI